MQWKSYLLFMNIVTIHLSWDFPTNSITLSPNSHFSPGNFRVIFSYTKCQQSRISYLGKSLHVTQNREILFNCRDVRLKVYKMAAVGCLERDRGKEAMAKEGLQVLEFRRKSGVNRSFCFDDKSPNCLGSNGGLIEKLCRLNGSVKTSFIEPSMPTLRSRGDRRSSGSDSQRRKRRLSRSEKDDA